MENYIKYTTHGKSYTIETDLSFTADKPNDSVASEVYLQVRKDSDNRMVSGEISPVLNKEELDNLPENEREWHNITNIVFADYVSKQQLSAPYLHDSVTGTYKVKPLLSNED